MLERLEQQKKLTANQWRIILTTNLGDMLDFFDFFLIGYVLAYIAGSWFTAQDVWERLRQRAIDVHFLMLAVALGSASIGAWGEGARTP